MKKYIKPTTDIHPSDVNILADSLTLGIYNYDKYDIGDVDDHSITNGNQVLIIRHRDLWEQ